MRRRALLVAVGPAILLAGVSAACGGDAGPGGERPRVVTTLPLFADFVRSVGGERVEVSALLPGGADPHTFEPAPRDLRAVAEADIAFGNGMSLEPSADKIIEANLKSGARYVKLAESAAENGVQLIDGNPHLWLDIDAALTYAAIIRDSLSEMDAAGAAGYSDGYEAYAAALAELSRYAGERVGSIPPADRKLVTSHDAFPYLARYLGLEVVAVAEEAPGRESSPRDVVDLAEALEQEEVPAVFKEPQVEAANRLLEQAASEAGLPVCTLYSDSLDERVRSYVELIRFNADELARCLGGAGGG